MSGFRAKGLNNVHNLIINNSVTLIGCDVFGDNYNCTKNTAFYLYPDLNRPQREAGHSQAHSVGVKNAWNCTSALLYVFMRRTGTSPLLIYLRK